MIILCSKHISWNHDILSKEDYRNLTGHSSAVIWFTGLSGSGKSTIASLLEKKLFHQRIHSYNLDGDHVRFGLNKDLGFSKDDRKENIRRVGEVAKLFVNAGIVVTTALISPFEKDRQQVRSLFDENEFIEVYVKCPLTVCEQRDPKGLYEKARNGVISQFTGLDSPYEEPKHPDLILETNHLTADECAKIVFNYLKNKGIV